MARRRSTKTHRYGVGTYDITADGRHRWRYMAPLPGGGTYRKDIRKRALTDLDAAVDTFLREAQRIGASAKPDAHTVESYCAEWLTTIVALRNAPSTVDKYRWDLSRILTYIGNRRLQALTGRQIQQAIDAMMKRRDRPWSTATIRRSVEVLRNALNDATNEPFHYLTRNPAAGVTLPKAETYTAYTLSVDEAMRLLEAAAQTRHAPLIYLYLTLGLRRGEGLGIRIKDVDLESHTVTIAQQVVPLNNRPTLSSTLKSAGSATTLPLPEALVPMVRVHLDDIAAMRETRMQQGRWTEHGLLFPSEVGTPISPRNLVRVFKSVLHQAGLPTTIRIHDLRHSVPTILAALGEHPKIVQGILRHSDIKITMDVYTHINLDQQRTAVNRLAAIWMQTREQDATKRVS